MDTFFDRHQDNVLDVGAMLGTLAANKKYPGLPLTLDPDAPFIMRGLAGRMTWSLTTGQNDLSQLYFKLKRASTVYTSNEWLPFSLLARAMGQGGNPYPWWPHENYPAAGTIEIDVWNNGASTLAGVQLVFRGVKRFPKRPDAPAYPAKFRPCNWTRSVKVFNVGVSGPTAEINRFLLTPITDHDFVLRHIQAGPVYDPHSPDPFFVPRNVWVTLRDAADKPFSNAPVDWNILCGQGTMALAAGLDNSEQFGPFHPGLFVPEIYIPKYSAYSMDILRDDSAYVGEPGIGVERLDFALGGIKVFEQ